MQQVLQEIEAAQGSINLNDLARKLGIEQSALAGMIEFWIRKGRITTNEWALDSVCGECSGAACGGNYPDPQGCPFVMKMPRTFSLVWMDEDY
ncbi:FeoC-like transcriptional regulator [Chloroflexota bacterium]